MKKLAIIPARYGSTRFPGKPLIDLAGKTMIQRVYEGVIETQLFDEVIVATDHQKIVDHILAINGKVIMTKESHNSGTERCGEVIETYTNFDIVVNVQGDEPLVNKEQLSVLLKAFDDPSVQIASIGCPNITKDDLTNPNRIKIVINHQSDAIYFSRSAIPYERNQKNYPYLRHIGLYGFRAETLQKIVQLPETSLEETESLEQLRWLYYGFPIRIAETTVETPNIDTPEDVETVLRILRK